MKTGDADDGGFVQQGAPTPLLVHAKLYSADDADSRSIELSTIIAFLARNVLLIGGLMLLLGGLAVAGSYLRPRIYRAEMVLEPNSGDNPAGGGAMGNIASQLGGVGALLGVPLGGAGRSAAASLAIVQSRHLIEPFIADHNLLPILYARYWDAETKKWRLRWWWSREPTAEDAYELFTRHVMSAHENPKNGLVEFAVEWRDPQLAADWANELITQANKYIARQSAEESALNLAYLNDELKRTDQVEVRTAIYSVMESEIKKEMLARTKADYAFRVLDAATVQPLHLSVKPIRVIYFGSGAAFGLLIGVIIALKRERRRSAPDGATTTILQHGRVR